MQANRDIKISVLIPTLGIKIRALENLLKSLSQQLYDFSQLEVLLVLNGPVQASLDSLKTYGLPYKILRVQKTGVNRARDLGMQESCGQLILMLDDDVEIPHSHFLEQLVSTHRRHSECLAIGGLYRSKKSYSLYDRLYNLDAHLSTLASRRGEYSVDLLGGCVSYKREKLKALNVWPNTQLKYGASESEFHHRMFQAGGLLKFDPSLFVYHQPEMTLSSYCRKAYWQGYGFKHYCRIRNGPKRSIKLSLLPSFFLWLRELCFSWGKGDFFLSRPLLPIRNVILQGSGNIKETFSRLKWALIQIYYDGNHRRVNSRHQHYLNQGTIYVSSVEKINEDKLDLAQAWSCYSMQKLEHGMDLLKSQQGEELLAIDIAQVYSYEKLNPWFNKYAERPVLVHCSDRMLTPYDIKRKSQSALQLLRMLKPKVQIKTITLVQAEHLQRWGKPQVIFSSRFALTGLKFSVIIPFFNNQLLLKKVVQSLIEQKFPKEKYEIILVSDGSSTEEVSGILEYLRAQQRINLSLIQWEKSKERPKEFRAGMARQIGALYAVGDNLSFLDSDILVQSDYLIEMEKALAIYDVIQAKRRMLNAEETDRTLKSDSIDFPRLNNQIYAEEAYWENFKNAKEWESLWACWKYTCTYSLTLQRQNFFAVGGFRPQYNQYGFEDVDLGYRCYLQGLRFGFVKSEVYHLYPQGSGAAHHFNAQEREKLLVKSCETFYRLNLSPSLFEEFKFFLQGRNMGYQTLKAHDLAHFLWWKGQLLAVQHSVRMNGNAAYWGGHHLLSSARGETRKHMVRLYWCSKEASIQLFWATRAFLSDVYFGHMHAVLTKPYYMVRFQWKKRVLRSKDLFSEGAGE